MPWWWGPECEHFGTATTADDPAIGRVPGTSASGVGVATTTKAPRVRLNANYWRLWTASVISNLGDGVGAMANQAMP